ncbi:MAG TPA: hypothetical protein VMF86_17575 [Stellaceae bacterium]|nr:hypothetical protein [Stellaceae bacterium]
MRPVRTTFRKPGLPRGATNSVWRDGGDSGFASRLDLPLAWEALDGPPAEAMRDATRQANAANLALLLHGVDILASPRVADEQLDEALAPIRTTLDIVVAMLARLSYRSVDLPPCCYIELGERQVAWLADRPLQPGTWLRIAIYFDATFREPIVVFAKATGSTALAGGQCRNEAELETIAGPILDDLARLALLVQRRQRSRRDTGVSERATW